MSLSAVDVHGDRTATGTSDHDIGMVLVEFTLGDADCLVEVVVGEGRVEDRVSLVLQAGRFDATG